MALFSVVLWSRRRVWVEVGGKVPLFDFAIGAPMPPVEARLWREATGREVTAYDQHDTNLREASRVQWPFTVQRCVLSVQGTDIVRSLHAEWEFAQTRVPLTGGPLFGDGVLIFDFGPGAEVFLRSDSMFRLNVGVEAPPGSYVVAARIEGQVEM